MRIDARASEWKPLVELLENGEFDSSRSLANAIIKQSYETFLQREWFAVVMRNEGMNILWGLFATENAARVAITENELGVRGKVGVFKIASATARAQYVKENI